MFRVWNTSGAKMLSTSFCLPLIFSVNIDFRAKLIFLSWNRYLVQKSKFFLILATFFVAPIDAFDDIYLRCAGGTVFIGVVQSLRQRLQGNGNVVLDKPSREERAV